MDRSRIVIVIPALNEAETISAVVSNAKAFGTPVVVDDGSTDNTGERARDAGAIVVRSAVNRGYDRALDQGFECAVNIGGDCIVTMDADGQHDPTALASFVGALSRNVDVVVGVRDRRQRFAEHLFALVTFVRWRVRDPLCGMKAYRADLYRELGHFDSYNSIGTELLLYAAARGKRIVQIPVKTRERTGAPRFGRVFSANLRILRALWLGMTRGRG